MPRELNPESLAQWLSVISRYIVCPLLGVLLLLHETWSTADTRLWVIIAGLTLLGYPVANLLDVVRGNNGK